MAVRLGPAQARALAHVAARSSGPPLPPDLRVTLHLHPDRAHPATGCLLLDQLAADGGRYRSQFETGTSNGGLTAHPGGDRWRWESRIFGGAYDDRPASERPVYGSLDHRRRPHGGSPRFGSTHLRLRSDVLDRTTFCYPDSVFEPTAFGTRERAGVVAVADADERDRLDDYVEAQVHGPVLVERDVEAVVLDPCYRGTDVERSARRLGVEVGWHPGWRLGVPELEQHEAYRGPAAVELGRRVAVDGWLDARVVGRAARDGGHDPQTLKQVWHLVARFGTPAP
ncbi:DUF3626 domain-containing protein [Angustibacter peucedani]